MLPANIYQYFNDDMKIFNFEIPGVPNLIGDWFTSMKVNLRLYESDDKFSNYGIESMAFIKQVTQAALSGLPLTVFYSAQYLTGKLIGIGFKSIGAKVAGAASATLLFNYPLRFGFE